ncbi:MAG: dihydroorotase [Tannerellaceae bacterium]|nr:dihydroorotase [Tannerellaceae bacterium]
MKDALLIYNACVVNEGSAFDGSVLVVDGMIADVVEGKMEYPGFGETLDAGGRLLLPGVIDDQVHFREPGLTHKGDISSESRAAVAGGVTTFMDMPNTRPETTSLDQLYWKLDRAAETSVANYSFFFGATNTNGGELSRLDRKRVPGVKVFLGASTGDMLVDSPSALERIFGESGALIAVHAESEEIIARNREYYAAITGGAPGISFHPLIRSDEACYASSAAAVDMASRLGARLHLLHLSTARELGLLTNDRPVKDKMVTAEACVHHLWFSDKDYKRLGNRIKWNPSIKTAADRDALRGAVSCGLIDVVATDHAPHLLSEKEGDCLTAASGGPMVQHSLIAMLEMASRGAFSVATVVERMSHAPADLFRIDRRGYIRRGYHADLVIVDPRDAITVLPGNILYRCGWSPFEGVRFSQSVWKTFVNGRLAFDCGLVNGYVRGMEVAYNA